MSNAVDHVMEMLQHADLDPEQWAELATRVKGKASTIIADSEPSEELLKAFEWLDELDAEYPQEAGADPEVLYHINDVLNDLASNLGVDMEGEGVDTALDDLAHEFTKRFNL